MTLRAAKPSRYLALGQMAVLVLPQPHGVLFGDLPPYDLRTCLSSCTIASSAARRFRKSHPELRVVGVGDFVAQLTQRAIKQDAELRCLIVSHFQFHRHASLRPSRRTRGVRRLCVSTWVVRSTLGPKVTIEGGTSAAPTKPGMPSKRIDAIRPYRPSGTSFKLVPVFDMRIIPWTSAPRWRRR